MNEHKFDGKAAVYSRSRPSYPPSLLRSLLGSDPLAPSFTAADIGSGTGKFTRMLLEGGCRVLAVEPNPDMRAEAERCLGGFDGFVSVDGTAEDTTIPPESVDLVTCAQSFHWFDTAAFRRECLRILKPGAPVALIWNNRVDTSPLVRENFAVNKKFCPHFKGFSGGGLDRLEDELRLFFTGGYKAETFPNDLHFTLEGFIERNLSSSYAPREGEDNYDGYCAALRDLFFRFEENSVLTLPNVTRCYIGKIKS